MNYYNNFEKIEQIENSNQYEFGILEKEDNIFYVNNKEVE